MSRSSIHRSHIVRALRFSAQVSVLGTALPAQADAPSARAPAAADLGTRYTIDDAHPEASLPTAEEAMKNPLEMGYLLMDLIARAEAATKSGDHAAAVRYYQATARAVPDRALSFSRLCRAYQALGDTLHAVESCKQALGKGGVQIEDHVFFVKLMLEREGALSGTDLDDIDAVIAHLDQELSNDPQGLLTAAHLSCEVAARLEDSARLSRCTERLQALAPEDARTFTYRWALALSERDLDGADAILREAHDAQLPKPVLAEMKSSLEHAREQPAAWTAYLLDIKSWLVAALLGSIALVLSSRSRPRLSST